MSDRPLGDLRDRIAQALEDADYRPDMKRGDLADAVMPIVEEEIAQLRSWNGLMAVLDENYPPDVFTGDGTRGDPGPRIIALTRELDRLRGEH